jgi:tetratricopeptide (TPR) repeat protein
MRLNGTQIAVISGSLLLIVLLLFANTQIPSEENKSSEHAGNTAGEAQGIQVLVDAAKAGLTASQKQKMEQMEVALSASPDKKRAFENMINTWDSLKQPAVAAYYMEQAAIASPIARNWNEAGNRYYNATRFVQEDQRPALYGKAIECYQKTLALEPGNTDAKINLGACYVEGSAEPMKGIGILKEVEKTDSNNVNLQLNFAFFSEKSGQWDKAISRFEKVLKIQPDFIEAYLHLADAYTQKADTVNTIKNLEKYISLVDDVTIKAEIQDYINKLKTN